jgi:hypothetical protein
MIAPTDPWIESVRDAASGPPLLALLHQRMVAPHDEGPPLDDRRGEAPEEVFERLAREDSAFGLRLDDTIAGYFRTPQARPDDEEEALVVRSLLELVQRVPLTGGFTALRAWLGTFEKELRADPNAILGRALLGALATAQPVAMTEVRDFWRRWWRDGPPPWQPAAFIGLRRQDPRAAAEELPLLVERAAERNQDPGALLQGMWQQPDARDALVEALRCGEAWAAEARKALLRRLSGEERGRLAALLGDTPAPEHRRWARSALEAADRVLGRSARDLARLCPPANLRETFAGPSL